TPAGSAQDLWRRFVQEAQIMQSLRHPCIVQLLDFHESAGALVMEYVGHGSLADAAQGQPLPLGQVRQVLLDVLDGLQHAHTAGVLHRDLKPHNLFVSPTGRTLIGDFGVAFLQGLGATQTESFVGTLAYMAPEQLGGQPLSVATDLYALGVTTFQLLTGQLPFAGPDFVEQHLRTPAPDPRELRPTLPTAWAELIRRALQKPMSARFASCDAMRTAVLKLPTDDLEDTSWLSRSQQKPPTTIAEQQQLSQATAQLPVTATELYRTTYSRVFLSSDSQLNRPLLIERYHAGVLQSPAAAPHRSWLQHFARLGGPGLQRILRIKLRGNSPAPLSSPAEAEAEVHFEVPSGFAVTAAETHGSMLSQSDVSRLRHLLTASHQLGVPHGSVATSVVIEPTGAMLLLHGRGPLFAPPATTPASLDDDLSQLAALAGVATSSARPRP
ncbi:MAG TPA: serine/threonine-protein kinase, partial [Pseudomonadota bacterium]|nr:serine/threonine-protein kinase [Pseudomonadota bacterium]